MSFFDDVYATVRRIPYGRVATYAQIALLAGRPRAARAVGTAMAKNPYGPAVPCHRVLRADGSLGIPTVNGEQDWQRTRLENEGIEVFGNRVELRIYQWTGK